MILVVTAKYLHHDSSLITQRFSASKFAVRGLMEGIELELYDNKYTGTSFAAWNKTVASNKNNASNESIDSN